MPCRCMYACVGARVRVYACMCECECLYSEYLGVWVRDMCVFVCVTLSIVCVPVWVLCVTPHVCEWLNVCSSALIKWWFAAGTRGQFWSITVTCLSQLETWWFAHPGLFPYFKPWQYRLYKNSTSTYSSRPWPNSPWIARISTELLFLGSPILGDKVSHYPIHCRIRINSFYIIQFTD